MRVLTNTGHCHRELGPLSTEYAVHVEDQRRKSEAREHARSCLLLPSLRVCLSIWDQKVTVQARNTLFATGSESGIVSQDLYWGDAYILYIYTSVYVHAVLPLPPGAISGGASIASDTHSLTTCFAEDGSLR